MILQVWKHGDGSELVINQVVRNESEGLGIGLVFFQSEADRAIREEDWHPETDMLLVKTKKRPKREGVLPFLGKARAVWDIGLIWLEEYKGADGYDYDDGSIIVL